MTNLGKIGLPANFIHAAAEEGPGRVGDRSSLADRLVGIGFVIAIAAVGLQTVLHLLNAAIDHRLVRFDADIEGGLPTWASSSATFAVALLALVIALAHHPRQRAYAVLAGAFAFFSLDDALVIHEELGAEAAALVGAPEYFVRVSWVILYLPLLAVALAILFSIARQAAPPAARRAIRIGLALLVAAVLAEVVSTGFFALGFSYGGWPDTLEVAVEEGLELGAMILIAAALTGVLVAHLAAGGADTPSPSALPARDLAELPIRRVSGSP